VAGDDVRGGGEMKRLEYSDIKKAFDGGQNIFRRTSIFPLLVEIEILQAELARRDGKVVKKVKEKSEWRGQPYKVYYFEAENPIHLEAWLEKMLVEQGLFLITANENYYVFRVIEKERIG
jgi:hypothetical protein